MGAIKELRLSLQHPFTSIQADLIGPYFIKSFVNQRTTRKIWLLSTICDFSRYITNIPVEDLTKQALLNTFKLHFIQYGVSSRIECDFGTNFIAAKDNLETDHLSEDDVKYITEELKSQGTCLVVN